MKKRVTFEVDDIKLFDTIKAMSGETAYLGDRIVGSLLSEPGTADLIGMAVYGVVYVGTETVEGEANGEGH